MDEKILKNFCYVFNHKAKQVKVEARLNRSVPVNDIIKPGLDGLKYIYYDMYKEVMDRYTETGNKEDYTTTRLYKLEWEIAPKNNKAQVAKRFKAFYALFDSIKTNGFKRRSNRMVKLIDIEGKPRTNPVRGERFSEKYYRVNGMKRCFIAKYLGVKEIPCRVLKIRIVQI